MGGIDGRSAIGPRSPPGREQGEGRTTLAAEALGLAGRSRSRPGLPDVAIFVRLESTMEPGIVLLTIGVYGLAGYLWWHEQTPNYLIALVAGHCGSLLSPLWQSLYGFVYNQQFPPLYTLFGNPLPRPIFIGAWTIMLPPLLIFFLFRHRWWFTGYTTGLLTFVLFVLYHLLVESVGVRAGWWCYTGRSALPIDVPLMPLAPPPVSPSCSAPVLPFGMPVAYLSALMNGLVSLGLLSVLLLTHRYAWTSLIWILPPIPLLLSLFVNGLLGAPLYAALLLRAQSWAGAIGMLGTLGLLVWGAHIVAGSLSQPNNWRQVI